MKIFMNANKNSHDAVLNMVITFGLLQIVLLHQYY